MQNEKVSIGQTDKMQKVIVIGCSGSGKSTFSKKLRDRSGLPLYHLDLIYWREDGTVLDKDELDIRLDGIISEDSWIIDGNYSRTMEKRMAACDTVFFFDIPTEDCIAGVRKRHGKPRSDMAWKQARDSEDAEFMEFIKNYNTTHRPKVLELLSKYSDKNIVIFKNRQSADRFIINV